MSKVRKVDFSPDEFLVGVAGMPAFDIGVYWVLNSLMYSSGGTIHQTDERLFSIVKNHANAIRPAIERLVGAGKLKRDEGGYLSKTRVTRELDAAETRITQARDAGKTGGRPRKITEENQSVEKPEALFSEKPSPSPSPSPSTISAKADIAHSPRNPRRHRLAIDWKPSEADRDYGWQLTLSDGEIDWEAERFRRYWTGPDAKGGGLKADWSRTWFNWLDRCAGDIIGRRNGGKRASQNGRGPVGVVETIARLRSEGSGEAAIHGMGDGMGVCEIRHGAGGNAGEPKANGAFVGPIIEADEAARMHRTFRRVETSDDSKTRAKSGS